MIDGTDLTDKAPPYGRWNVFAKPRLLPDAIDAARSAGLALEQMVRRRPSPALAVAVCAGFLATLSLRHGAR